MTKQQCEIWNKHFEIASGYSQQPAQIADVLTFGVVRRQTVADKLVCVRVSEYREEWYYKGVQIYSGLPVSHEGLSLPVLTALRRMGVDFPAGMHLWRTKLQLPALL